MLAKTHHKIELHTANNRPTYSLKYGFLLAMSIQNTIIIVSHFQIKRKPNKGFYCLELLPHVGMKRCYEMKIEKSEKAVSHRE